MKRTFTIVSILFLIILLETSCKKEVQSEAAEIGLISTVSSEVGEVQNVLLNPDGSILVHTLQNLDSNSEFNTYWLNKFFLLSKDYKMLKSIEISGGIMHDPFREGDKILFPGFNYTSYSAANMGVFEVDMKLNEPVKFYNCQSSVKQASEFELWYPGRVPVFLGKFENGDWCLAYNINTDTGVFHPLHPVYVNLGSNYKQPSRKWKKLGTPTTRITSLYSLPGGVFSFETFTPYGIGSYNGYSGILRSDGKRDATFHKLLGGMNYMKGGCIQDQANGIAIFGYNHVARFDESGSLVDNVSLPFHYYNKSFTGRINLPNGKYAMLTDTTGLVNHNCGLITLSNDFKEERILLFKARRQPLTTYYNNGLIVPIEYTLIRKPEGGYLLFLQKEANTYNRNNWVFINLDENLNPPQ